MSHRGLDIWYCPRCGRPYYNSLCTHALVGNHQSDKDEDVARARVLVADPEHAARIHLRYMLSLHSNNPAHDATSFTDQGWKGGTT